MTRHTSRRPLALAALALWAAACGGHLTDQEILEASAVRGPVSAPGSLTSEAGAGDDLVAGPEATAPVGSDGAVSSPTADGSIAPGGGSTDGGEAVGTPGETGPIVIGSVGNYSGPAGPAQAPIPRGVQAWAAMINSRGGLFGREVQFIVVDDGGDPARYASALRDLVENRGVVAFVGNGATLSRTGGQEYLERNHVPVIGSECSGQDWFSSPVYFPACPTYQDIVIDVMAAGHDISGKSKFGYLICSEATSCTGQRPLLESGAAAAGVEIVYGGDISLTQVDFTAECRNAASCRGRAVLRRGRPEHTRPGGALLRSPGLPTAVHPAVGLDHA